MPDLTNPQSPWLAENLRLTLFPSDPIDARFAATWYAAVFGTRPETESFTQTTLSSQMVGVLSDLFPGASVLVTASPGRVDWQIVAAPEEESVGWPTLGSFEDTATRSREWMIRASRIQALQPKRAAVGAVLMRPALSREDGYRDLQRYLPGVQIDAGGMEDLLFQVNRPRLYESIKVNRLGKYSVGRRSFTKFVFGPDGSTMTPAITDYASRLELDLNTDADRVESLPMGGDLISTLLDMGIEMAQVGDVP